MTDPTWSAGDVSLWRGDCLDVMRGMDAGSVDAVVTDPPYFEIASEDWDKQWDGINEWAQWCTLWGHELCRILKDSGSALIFGDDKHIAYMQVALDKLEWGLLNNIVWSKTNYTALKASPEALRSFAVQAEERILYYGRDISFPSFSEIRNPKAAQPMAKYMREERKRAGISAKEIAALFPSKTGGMTGCVSNWELGLNFPLKEQYEKIRNYLNKCGEYDYMRREYEDMRREYEDMRRPFNGNGLTDVWSGPAISSTHKMHPSHKPRWIIDRCVLTITNPGDTVLDCFLGSGETGISCHKTGRRFMGIEIDPGYFDIAVSRIQDAQRQPPLFV